MIAPPRIDLNKLVGQIVLDVALLIWFANHDRRVAALSAIAVTRTAKGDPRTALRGPLKPKPRRAGMSAGPLLLALGTSGHRRYFFLAGNGLSFTAFSAASAFSDSLACLIARSRFSLSSGVISLSSSGLSGIQSSFNPPALR
jgi:hypothetical protein